MMMAALAGPLQQYRRGSAGLGRMGVVPAGGAAPGGRECGVPVGVVVSGGPEPTAVHYCTDRPKGAFIVSLPTPLPDARPVHVSIRAVHWGAHAPAQCTSGISEGIAPPTSDTTSRQPSTGAFEGWVRMGEARGCALCATPPQPPLLPNTSKGQGHPHRLRGGGVSDPPQRHPRPPPQRLRLRLPPKPCTACAVPLSEGARGPSPGPRGTLPLHSCRFGPQEMRLLVEQYKSANKTAANTILRHEQGAKELQEQCDRYALR